MIDLPSLGAHALAFYLLFMVAFFVAVKGLAKV